MKNLLVIGQNPEIFRLVEKSCLHHKDFSVVGAESFKQAEAIILKTTIDILIIDAVLIKDRVNGAIEYIHQFCGNSKKIVLVLPKKYPENISHRIEKEIGVDYIISMPLTLAMIDDLLVKLGERHKTTSSIYSEAFLKQIYRVERFASLVVKTPALKDDFIRELKFLKRTALANNYLIIERLIDEIVAEVGEGNIGDIAKIRLAYDLEMEDEHGIDVYFVGSDKKMLSLTAEKATILGMKFITESDPLVAKDLLEKNDFFPRVLIVDEEYPDSDVSGFDLVKVYKATHGDSAGSLGMIFDDVEVSARVEAMKKGVEVFVSKSFAINKLLEACQLELSLKEPNEFKVLMLDNDQETCDFIVKSLGAIGIHCRTFGCGDDLFEELKKYNPDLLIMEISLPDYDGLNLLRLLRFDFYYKDLPVIVTSKDSDDVVVEAAYRIGIDDYMTKPLSSNVFQARITNFTQKVIYQNVVRDRDSLTGLLNRRAFVEQFQMSLWRSLRTNMKMTFALIDLDLFKNVNDTYGHVAGDEVLVRFSRFLLSYFRRSDLIGRWGGEEFAILLEDVELVKAEKLLNDLLLNFQIEPLLMREPKLRITFSCGLVGFPEGGASLEELYRAADKALYLAKEKGRNRIVSVA
jgi:diguanylate cyclase (GGDEF)-like protein